MLSWKNTKLNKLSAGSVVQSQEAPQHSQIKKINKRLYCAMSSEIPHSISTKQQQAILYKEAYKSVL